MLSSKFYIHNFKVARVEYHQTTVTNPVLTLSTGNATALKSSSEEINCLEARSVNFHTLSPISLKVEVLNQIKSSQCTMELCKK